MQVDQVKAYLLALQDRICAALAGEDGGTAFRTDEWQRPEVVFWPMARYSRRRE